MTFLSPRGVAVALLLGATVIWGGTYVVTKELLSEFAPFSIMVMRFTLAFLALLPLALRAGFRPRHILNPRLAAFGLTGMVLHLGLETTGLRFTTASTAALIVASSPAITAAMSAAFGRERINARQVIGAVLSIAGVLVITGAAGPGSGRAIGNILVVAGVIAWAIYTLQGRTVGASYPTLVSTTAALGAATLMSAPIAIWETSMAGTPEFTGNTVIAMLYLGGGASALAFLAWNAALTRIEAATAGLFVNVVPVVGVALGLVLGEGLAIAQVIGGVVVAAGVAIGVSSPRRGHVVFPHRVAAPSSPERVAA